MAIAIQTNGSMGSTGGLTLTQSVTLAGANRALVVWVYNEATGGAITSVKHNSIGMTQFASIVVPNAGTNRTLYGFYLAAPTIGTFDIVTTRPSTAGGSMYGAYVQVTGANQSGIPSTSATVAVNTTTGNYTLSTTTTVDNTLVLGASVNETTANGIGANTTSLDSASNLLSARRTTVPSTPAGSFGISWTGGATDNAAAITASFAPVVAFPTQSAGFVAASLQSLTRADTTSLSITGNITLETWVKFTTLGSDQRLINKFQSTAGNIRGNYELFVNASDKLDLIYSADGTYDAGQYTERRQDTASIVSTGVWYHVKGTATVASQVITLYVDGAVVPSSNIATGATSIGDQNYPIGVGARNENGTMGGFLNGRMSLARVWSEVHAADDKCIVFGAASNLAAEWTLDNTLTDNAGNANTLTNNNAVTFSADVPGTCAVVGIAFDAAAQSSPVGAVGSRTWAHTCTGSNRILFVGFYTGTAFGSVTSVTYAGVEMKKINTVGGGNTNSFLYYLIAPTTGTNNVVVTIANSDSLAGSSMSYTGANQTAQPDANTIGHSTGTNLTDTLTVGAENSWAVLWFRNESDGNSTGGANSVARIGAGSGNNQGYDSGGEVAAGSFSMTVNQGGSFEAWRNMASFQPVNATAGVMDLEASSSQYASAASSTSLGVTGNITYETWVKLESLPGAASAMFIAAKFTSTGDKRCWAMQLDNGNSSAGSQVLFFYIDKLGDNATPTSAYCTWTPTVGVWYHVAGVTTLGSPATIELFIDGVSTAVTYNVQTNTTAIFNANEPTVLGAINTSATPALFFDGKQQLGRLWGSQRTAAELMANWCSPIGGSDVSVDTLVVAGGGGGGCYGGGAAGGMKPTTIDIADASRAYTITVGAGGTGAVDKNAKGVNGGNSVFDSGGVLQITSTGGGGGGSQDIDSGNGAAGGSGSGGAQGAGGAGTVGQGNNGGTGASDGGGGGGGAGAVGGNSTADNGAVGGAGTASLISGASVTYAGGGGGGGTTTAGAGGAGGGGAGATGTNTGTAGTANRGGGGGGARNLGGAGSGGAGGSGVVIISAPQGRFTATGGTFTNSGGKDIWTFTSSGTWTPTSALKAEWTLNNTLSDTSGNSNTLTNVNSFVFSPDQPTICVVGALHFSPFPSHYNT